MNLKANVLWIIIVAFLLASSPAEGQEMEPVVENSFPIANGDLPWFGDYMAVSPIGNTVATWHTDDKCPRIYDYSTGRLLWEVEQEKKKNPVTSCSFSPDGKMLAAGCMQYLKIWDLQSRTLLRKLEADNRIEGLLFIADDRITTITFKGVVEYWNWQEKKRLGKYSTSQRTADGTYSTLWPVPKAWWLSDHPML